MKFTPTTNTSGICDGCGRQLMWGGTSWWPHDDFYHQAQRGRVIDGLYFNLLVRLGRITGHSVVLRFTREWSWHECSCGDRGYDCRYSCAAVLTARNHLAVEGWLTLAPGFQGTVGERVSETEERTP